MNDLGSIWAYIFAQESTRLDLGLPRLNLCSEVNQVRLKLYLGLYLCSGIDQVRPSSYLGLIFAQKSIRLGLSST
jgi:hypothetical protein